MLTISVAKQAEGALLRMGIDRIEFRATYATDYQLYCYFTQSIYLGTALSASHAMERTQRISLQVVFFDKQRSQESYQLIFSTAKAFYQFTCGFVTISIGLKQQAELPRLYLQFVKFFNLKGSKVFLEDGRKQAFLPEKIVYSIPIYGERIKFTISTHKQINYEISPQIGVFQTRFPNGIGMCFYFADSEQGGAEEFIFPEFETASSGFCTKKVPVFVRHDETTLYKNDNAVLTPEPAADAFYCFNGNFVKYDPEIVSKIEELQLKSSSPAAKQLFDDLVYFDDSNQPYKLAKGQEKAADASDYDVRVYIYAVEPPKVDRACSEQGIYGSTAKAADSEPLGGKVAEAEKTVVSWHGCEENAVSSHEDGISFCNLPPEYDCQIKAVASSLQVRPSPPDNTDTYSKESVGWLTDEQRTKPKRQDRPEPLDPQPRYKALSGKDPGGKTAAQEDNTECCASKSCSCQQKEADARPLPTKSTAQKRTSASSDLVESEASFYQLCSKSASKAPGIAGNRNMAAEQARSSVQESANRVPAHILLYNSVIEADGSGVRFLEDYRGEPLTVDGSIVYAVRGKLCRRVAIDGYVCYQELGPSVRAQIDGQKSEALGSQNATRIYTDKNGAQYVEAFGQRFLLRYQHKLAYKARNSAETSQYQAKHKSKAGSAQLCKQNDCRPSETLLPELKRRTRSQQRTKSDDRHQACEFSGVGHAVQRLQQQFIDCSKQFKMKTFNLGGFAK